MSITQPFDLSGRTALVTGGGSGLGLAIAHGLARAGAAVIINGRNLPKLEAAQADAHALGIELRVAAFDVTSEDEVAAGIGTLGGAGAIDILINNAGMNLRKAFDQLTVDEWRSVQAINVDGAFLVTRAVLPGMKARKRGKIINICSIASDLGRPNIVAYSTSKGGIKMLTKALAVELAPHGIQVNGIAPGFFRTEMNAALVADAKFSAWVEERTPAGRWGEPAEISGAAVFLASDAAAYVTGHLLYVDGGYAAAY